MGAFVPPFTTNIPVTTSIHVSTSIHVPPHAQIRARLDDRFLNTQNFTMSMTTREQLYDMTTSIMEGLQNASMFGDNVIPFPPYNANISLTSSVSG